MSGGLHPPAAADTLAHALDAGLVPHLRDAAGARRDILKALRAAGARSDLDFSFRSADPPVFDARLVRGDHLNQALLASDEGVDHELAPLPPGDCGVATAAEAPAAAAGVHALGAGVPLPRRRVASAPRYRDRFAPCLPPAPPSVKVPPPPNDARRSARGTLPAAGSAGQSVAGDALTAPASTVGVRRSPLRPASAAERRARAAVTAALPPSERLLRDAGFSYSITASNARLRQHFLGTISSVAPDQRYLVVDPAVARSGASRQPQQQQPRRQRPPPAPSAQSSQFWGVGLGLRKRL